MERIEFTKEMKKTHKILFPNMCDIHFKILQKLFLSLGYDMELLTTTERNIIGEGLKYVHNDTCYPALVTIGQMISALKSGNYDVDKTALIMTQTGGGCRASNYIHLLRKALENANMSNVPVISINFSGLEKNSGFKLSLSLLRKAVVSIVYGDMLMLLHNQTRPYEKIKGSSQNCVDKWVAFLSEKIHKKQALTNKQVENYLRQIVLDFENIEIIKSNKVKVGIVGEIYVKYSAVANNGLEEFLHSENCEVMIPGLLGFILYCIETRLDDIKLYGGNMITEKLLDTILTFFLKYEEIMISVLSESNFKAPSTFKHMKSLAKPIIGYGCKMGEGWLLTAEMMELIEQGYENIVCAQPFGCLPNHIVGKGMVRKIKEIHPTSNIVPIDYDPGATRVNQENRIKLMLAVARENLEKKEQNDNSKKISAAD